MNLRNYTSTVPVQNSLQAIETLLARAGAQQIAKSYENNQIKGVVFSLPIGEGPSRQVMLFKLPANPGAVAKVLKSEVKKPHRGTMQRIEEQAERTAWALLRDWVHIQLSIIQMEQAEAIQVFLPYAYDPRTEKTLFERMKQNGFKQLTTGEKP